MLMHSPEVTLGRAPFHWIVIFKKAYLQFLGLFLLSLAFYGLKFLEFISISTNLILIFILIFIFLFYLFNLWQRWSRSGLIITDKKLCLHVHHKMFGHYAMDLYFSQIRDTAFTYPSTIAGLLKYGNFMARSAGIEDLHNSNGITVNDICSPDKIKEYINYLLILPEEKRPIASPYKGFNAGQKIEGSNKKEEKIDLAIKTLHSIKGIKDINVLNQNDIDYIWKNEEERNSGAFEVLRRDVVLVCTHDEKLRPPANTIVISRGERHIFPAVPFPEIKEDNVVSCSPSKKIHEELSVRINIEKNDATLLIGFDI